MTPHPSYYTGYSDHYRDPYHSHYPTSTSRRAFAHCARQGDARPYLSPPMSPSPTPFSHKNDSFSHSVRQTAYRPVSNFNAASPARRSRVSSSSSSNCSLTQSPSPPKHPQLIKMRHPPVFRPPISSRAYRRRSLQLPPETMLCDFWKRGEVCRFEPHCWFAHGPMQLRTANENFSMCSDLKIPIPSNGSTAGQHIMEHSFSQLTPEQQQWMILSQKTHSFLPFPHNVASSLSSFKDQGKTTSMVEIAAPGRTCEELEREQTFYRRPLRAVGVCKPLEHVSHSTSGVDSLPSSGPSTPNFNGDFFLSDFDDYIKEKVSATTVMTSGGSSFVTQDSFANYAKEECPLHQYGYCPLKENCFFEHAEKKQMM